MPRMPIGSVGLAGRLQILVGVVESGLCDFTGQEGRIDWRDAATTAGGHIQ